MNILGNKNKSTQHGKLAQELQDLGISRNQANKIAYSMSLLKEGVLKAPEVFEHKRIYDSLSESNKKLADDMISAFLEAEALPSYNLDPNDFEWPEIEPEEGYEDIFDKAPYFEAEEEGDCLFLELLYVPKPYRRMGVGKWLFNELLKGLRDSNNIKRVRLLSSNLGSGPTWDFWSSLGFQKAYDTKKLSRDVDGIYRVMVLGVNGHPTPNPIPLTDSCEERDRLEHPDDVAFYEKHTYGCEF